MKKINLTARWPRYGLLFFILSFILFNPGCQKNHEEPAIAPDEELSDMAARGGGDHPLNDFKQVSLVANDAMYGAARVDTVLINAWGIAFSAGGVPWIGSQGGHVSTVYNREGGQQLAPVHIPSPAGNEGGNPTGVAANAVNADFNIPAGNGGANAAARFIFVGVDGIVSAWNPTWGNHSYKQFDHSATSAYTGLTLASNGGVAHLYAADFREGKIKVWDRTWAPVNMSFTDWRLPWGYYPFNIQVIGDQLYVTYAQRTADGRSRAGNGRGIVNVFSTSGQFIKRFASHGNLNAPWGVAKAPMSFFDNVYAENGILVGNFGNGRINVFDTTGKYIGQLRKNKTAPLVIDGLWAISFAPSTSTIDPNRLYFAAGPNHETDGLFGYVIKDTLVNPHGRRP
jgi:uncharacterized protein (TIGR03118 family)